MGDIHYFLAHPRILKLQSVCFKIFIVLILLLIVLYVGTRSLRKVVLSEIEKFTDTKVTASSVKFSLFGTAKIDDLVVRAKGLDQPDNIILTAQNVRAKLSKLSLLTFRPRLDSLRISDFTFNAVYDMDWRIWNFASIKLISPKSHDFSEIPDIRLERGILQYSKIVNGVKRVAAGTPFEFISKPDK